MGVARATFIAAARAAMASSEKIVELECSAVDVVAPLDDAVIGMLVSLAHSAHERGARVVLVGAPKAILTELRGADVDHLFDFRR